MNAAADRHAPRFDFAIPTPTPPRKGEGKSRLERGRIMDMCYAEAHNEKGEPVAYVYDFVVLLIWTGICAALVYGLERVLDAMGHRPAPMHGGAEPPLPPSE